MSHGVNKLRPRPEERGGEGRGENTCESLGGVMPVTAKREYPRIPLTIISQLIFFRRNEKFLYLLYCTHRQKKY